MSKSSNVSDFLLGNFGSVPLCPNCREVGNHFVPPSFGDSGFYICEIKDKKVK